MIRIRTAIGRGLRHPLLGPLLLLVLAAALALVVLHETADVSLDSLLAACAVLAFIAALAFPGQRPLLVDRRSVGAPGERFGEIPAGAPPPAHLPLPLRL